MIFWLSVMDLFFGTCSTLRTMVTIFFCIFILYAWRGFFNRVIRTPRFPRRLTQVRYAYDFCRSRTVKKYLIAFAILPQAEGGCAGGVRTGLPPPVRRHADTVCRSRRRSVLSGALRNTADGQFHLINRGSCVRRRLAPTCAIEAAVAHELHAAE